VQHPPTAKPFTTAFIKHPADCVATATVLLKRLPDPLLRFDRLRLEKKWTKGRQPEAPTLQHRLRIAERKLYMV
jgi:hypothetical protein